MPHVHNNVPDSAGLNLFRADPALQALTGLYLDDAVRPLALNAMDRMGALAGGPLDRLALEADANPPALHHRARTGAAEERITTPRVGWLAGWRAGQGGGEAGQALVDFAGNTRGPLPARATVAPGTDY